MGILIRPVALERGIELVMLEMTIRACVVYIVYRMYLLCEGFLWLWHLISSAYR